MEPVEPQDQRILHILPIESRLPIIDKSTLTSKIHFRIEKVSRRKDGRKFRLQIQIEGSNDGCSVFSDPILVLSKHRTDTNTNTSNTTTTTTTNLLSSSSAIAPSIMLNNNNNNNPPTIVDNTDMTKLIDMCTEILTRQNKTEQSLLILINRLENIERNIFQLRIPQFDLTQPSQKFDYLLPQQQLNNNTLLPESPHNKHHQQLSSSSSSSSPPPPVPLPQQVNITSASAGEMNGIKRSISSQMV